MDNSNLFTLRRQVDSEERHLEVLEKASIYMLSEVSGKGPIFVERVIDALLCHNHVAYEVSVVTAFDKDVGGASDLLLSPRLVDHQPFVVVIKEVLTDSDFLFLQVDAE